MVFLNKFNPFLKKFELNKTLLKKELESDYSTYLKIKDWFAEKQIKKDKITIYYPASGPDISTSFAIYDALVSENKFAHFIFTDFRQIDMIIAGNLKRYMPQAKIKEKYENGKYTAKLYFKDRTIKLTFYRRNANEFLPPEIKEKIDIYYERGFGSFRDELIQFITPHVRKNGLMITDYGFYHKNFKNQFKQLKNIPKEFGLYKKFQIWQKV